MQTTDICDRLSLVGRDILMSLRDAPARMSTIAERVGKKRVKESTIINLSDLYEVVENVDNGFDPLLRLTRRGNHVLDLIALGST